MAVETAQSCTAVRKTAPALRKALILQRENRQKLKIAVPPCGASLERAASISRRGPCTALQDISAGWSKTSARAGACAAGANRDRACRARRFRSRPEALTLPSAARPGAHGEGSHPAREKENSLFMLLASAPAKPPPEAAFRSSESYGLPADWIPGT
jgi:hypothetical protein